ncbi:hypothetical protein SUGI_1123210 [Cryptomeria japonica]|nr:hypothetical protein SUGI_1123210 [Cryptomeria japonica]
MDTKDLHACTPFIELESPSNQRFTYPEMQFEQGPDWGLENGRANQHFLCVNTSLALGFVEAQWIFEVQTTGCIHFSVLEYVATKGNKVLEVLEKATKKGNKVLEALEEATRMCNASRT